MKTVELAPLKDNDIQYDGLVNTLEERYKCNWEDAIHDSYGAYVRQMREHALSIRTVRCKAETLLKEIEDLQPDELSHRSDNLCAEADAV